MRLSIHCLGEVRIPLLQPLEFLPRLAGKLGRPAVPHWAGEWGLSHLLPQPGEGDGGGASGDWALVPGLQRGPQLPRIQSERGGVSRHCELSPDPKCKDALVLFPSPPPCTPMDSLTECLSAPDDDNCADDANNQDNVCGALTWAFRWSKHADSMHRPPPPPTPG